MPQAGQVFLVFDAGKAPPAAELGTHAEAVFGNAAFEVWRERE